NQISAQFRFKIKVAVRLAQRGKPAAVSTWNLRDPMRANYFLDQIDFALQIPPVAWNLPGASFQLAIGCRRQVGNLPHSFDSKTSQDFVSRRRFDVNAQELIKPLVAQGNICRVWRQFAGNADGGCRGCAGYFTN